MPLDDLAGGVLRALLRVAGEFLAEVVLDRLLKTPGDVVARYVLLANRRPVDPDGLLALVTGAALWAGAGALAWHLLR